MQQLNFFMFPLFAPIILLSWSHSPLTLLDWSVCLDLRAIGGVGLVIAYAKTAEPKIRARDDHPVEAAKQQRSRLNQKSTTWTGHQTQSSVGKENAKFTGTATTATGKKMVRYWTRPTTSWTSPDLSAFPTDGIIHHKWRPRYNPTQYHLNSLMVVQFEWDRMGERWGYAPLGPWCGLCQTLNKGCRTECQELCGEHCEGVGAVRFTDEIGCKFCAKDQGYGCRKYAECQANCVDCAKYTPFVNQTDTRFAWGPLERDLFGKEHKREFPDKEADTPWTPWKNPIKYDKTPLNVDL